MISGKAARYTLNVLRLVASLVAISLLAFALSNNASQIAAMGININVGSALASILVCIVGMLFLPVAPFLSFSLFGKDASYASVHHIYYQSNIYKYLPGGIWALPSRVVLYRRFDLATGQSIFLMLWELILLTAAASLIGLVFTFQLLVGTWLLYFLIAICLGLLIAAILLQNGLLSSIITKVTGKTAVDKSASLKLLLSMLFFNVIGLSLIGSAFALAVEAVHVEGLNLPHMIGIFWVAWVVGFLIPIAPSGIGVREGVIIWLLQALVVAPAPVLIAVVARILWMLGEGGSYLLSFVLLMLVSDQSQFDSSPTKIDDKPQL